MSIPFSVVSNHRPGLAWKGAAFSPFVGQDIHPCIYVHQPGEGFQVLIAEAYAAHRYPSGYHLGVGGPVYADAREAGCFQAEEAGAVYLAGSFLPRRVSRPKGGIFHGLYHEMPFRCPEIPFLLLVAVIASASDGKNGERIALRTKNGYPHILFGYYHPVRAVRFFFLRP